MGKGLYFSLCVKRQKAREKMRAAVREGVVDDDFNLAGGKTFN